MSTSWRLSPSDLTFLWDSCPRCFYLKVVHGISQPSTPMPAIFGRIHKLMNDHFRDRPTEELTPHLPPGVVQLGEKWVRSEVIVRPDHAKGCFIRGRFDTVAAFTDGSFGVIDFKTSDPKPEDAIFYARQLGAYAYALEHPASGSLHLAPVSRMGLLCVQPMQMAAMEGGQVAYVGALTWLECPKDEGQFLATIDQVLALLELPEPPEAHPQCIWCRYRDLARDTGF